MKLGELLNDYRSKYKISMDEFSKVSNLTKGYISMLEKNEHPRTKKPIIPSYETVQKIAKGMGISFEDLLTKLDADQEIAVNATPDFFFVSDIQKIYNQLKGVEKNKLLKYANNLLIKQESTEQLYAVTGLSASAAASGWGRGYGYDDNDIYTVYTNEEPPRHDISTMVIGDSMEPEYHDGEMLYLADKGISTYNGDLAVVVYEDRTYFKKVYTEQDQIRLISLNKKYDDICIDFPPAEDSHIKIFSVVGSFKPIEV
ncbi:XRE family transcriptional regulator [Streptococcus caviae]|uniref:XRE family transcriptional regulator n=1 Tax=Streptococcus sp. 'caviae' TaxID=1915004 RepID=UPI00094BAB98|nr:S24 family peptidase [Streptococcus sp. 'caviae']OLN84567.1 XRE family transcriptional regulator [Streptococcus sp. 'caviae']